MTTVVSGAHLRPVVERALTRRNGNDPACIIVAGDPANVPDLGDIDGEAVRTVGSRSPLDVRAELRQHRSEGKGVLVVVTDLDAGQLGDDLLARVLNRNVFVVDRWLTVCQLFGAERPSITLSRKAQLADALIEHRPLSGYPKVTAKILDADTAIAALLDTALGLADDATDSDLLDIGSRPDTAAFLHDATPALRDDIVAHLERRFGPAARATIWLVENGKGADLVAWGLAAAAIHRPDAERHDPVGAGTARKLLEHQAGNPRIATEDWQRFGHLAERLYTDSYYGDAQTRWRFGSAEVLDDLDATACARWSDVIPAGFDQRLADLATTLTSWASAPDDSSLADQAHDGVVALKRHHDRPQRADEITTCEMVARVIRRRSTTVTDNGGLVAVATAYRDDGSWLDLARVVVSRGSTQPALDALCRSLTATLDADRRDQAESIADVLAKTAVPLPEELTGVEAVLDRVVAPVADQRPALLVVLDGMGLSTFHEFAKELTAGNWTPVSAGPATTSPAVAVLPTVTEVSRTSLFAGTVRRGDGESEKRAFADHGRLRQVSNANRPPVLFHKKDLRVGGLDAPPDDVLRAISDTSRKVVGVVINNIDERLKDVVAPPGGWSITDLSPLRDLLAEARRAGRAVVLTADHGHIIDRDAEQRPGGGGGERWRPAAGNEPAPDEITVSGPRVADGLNTVILPTVEQIRYATRRNGYHGGLTLQEVLVPLVVLVTDDLDGWEPVRLSAPTWWQHTPTVAPVPAAVPSRPKPPTATPTLFDVDEPAEETVAGVDAQPELVQRLLASDLFTDQLANPRVRVDADTVARVLARLVDGTPLSEEALPALTGLASARAARFVTQLQELLNVDGYPVVRADGGEVRLDVALLTRQFDL